MRQLKYQSEIDLSNPNHAHTMLVDLVGSHKRVLEAGCATGYMSKVLVERSCSVVGIELDELAAEQAREYCEQVIVGDLETMDFAAELGGGSFDVIVFGDVLEHLRDPLPVLRAITPFLDDAGYVVASIPNFAHAAIRLELLMGRFDYRSLGLLDETHLRFFSRASIEKLFKDAGLAIAELRRTRASISESEFALDPADYPPAVIELIEQDPEAYTYQFVAKAVRDDGDQAIRELREREEAKELQLQKLTREVEDLRGRVGPLEEANQRLIAELDQARSDLRRHQASWNRVNRNPLVRAYRFARGAEDLGPHLEDGGPR